MSKVLIIMLFFLMLQQYGDIDYCSVLKDHNSGESKGLAYVKYYRGYCAAMAVENADSGKSATDHGYKVEVVTRFTSACFKLHWS